MSAIDFDMVMDAAQSQGESVKIRCTANPEVQILRRRGNVPE